MCNACQVNAPSDHHTEEVVEQLLTALNAGALGLMISIGYRTGLFDAMASTGPATSEQLAAAANLNERYVREWLGGVTTGRITTYDAETGRYTLPDAHAALLTRAATPNNMAVAFQFFSVLGEVESKIVDAFRNGGGVPYEQFTRFHEVMADESAQTVVSGLVDMILPLAPGAIDRLEAGIDVLDIGCGSGRALCEMAERFPESRFTGYDLCEETIGAARAEAQRRGLTNIQFERRDVTCLEEHASFDLVTGFDVIHDQRAPAEVLEQVHTVLRPGGTFLMQDIRASSFVEKNLEHPLAPFLYTISTMHCMTVSLAQGGAGLGTCWGEELAVRMLDDAGFQDVQVKRLDHDIMNNWYVMRKAA
jgi:2-polyprenyl-3-methyl-5-hydroxy-6-metoxy-1,4-benzoquinol methylase